MRKPVIAANWKMNKTTRETSDFISEFLPLVKNSHHAEIVIAPPFTSLFTASNMITDTSVLLAAQNMYFEDKGAFTGEVSPLMLKELDVTRVIIGHSERRQYFHETDETVNRKIRKAREHGFHVIFCIGESLEERESGRTMEIIDREVTGGLKDLSLDGIVIAYEPIWAIGTGKTATPEQAQEVHRFIREKLTSLYGSEADGMRILYGGSVTPENIRVLMSCPDVDGALVGGASLKADSFAKIVNFNV